MNSVDKCLSKTKEYYSKYNKEYYEKNKEKLKQTKKKTAWKEFATKHPEKVLNNSYKSRFNISYNDYLTLVQKQNNLCAICKNPETQTYNKSNKVKRLTVDHDHTTGKIRGLLCMTCNTALGKFKDNPAVLLSAISYLKEYS